MARRLVVLAVVACAAGCLSEQPIASGSREPIDRSLLGNWRCVFPDERDASPLAITAEEDRGLRAVFSGGDSQQSIFTAYAVKFEGGRLLNVGFEEKGKTWWTVAQYTLYRPGVLHVEYPKYDNTIFQSAKTPTERRDALRRGYRAKTLFQDSFTCVRIVEEKSPQ